MFRVILTLYHVPPSRAAGAGAGARFQLTPAHLHFGDVRVGARAARTAHLLNLAPAAARFSVGLPEAPVAVRASRQAPSGLRAVADRPSGPVWQRINDELGAGGLRRCLVTDHSGLHPSCMSPLRICCMSQRRPGCTWASMRPWLCRPAPPPHQGRCMQCWERSVTSPADLSADALGARMHTRAHCVWHAGRAAVAHDGHASLTAGAESQVSYARGPVAAGLAAALVVELAPHAPGAFVGEVRVASESSLFTLTLSARFVAPGGGAARGPDDPTGL